MTKTKTHTYRISVDSGKRTKMKTMTENFAKNFAGACVRDMRIELNLRQNVQFYRFRTFWSRQSKTHQMTTKTGSILSFSETVHQPLP